MKNNADQSITSGRELPFEARIKRKKSGDNDDHLMKEEQKPRSNKIIKTDGEDQQKQTASEEKLPKNELDFDISKAFNHGIEKAKSTFLRLIDHSKAFFMGLLAETLSYFIPSSVNLLPGFTLLTTYLGLVMLFPLRPNRFALGVGIMAGIIMIISGLWPLAPIVAGLIATVTGIRDQEIGNKIFWATIPLAILFIVLALLRSSYSIINITPLLTTIALLGLLIFGLLAPNSIRRKISYFFMKESEKQAYREEEKIRQEQNRIMEANQQLKNRADAKYALFSRHIEILSLIEAEMDTLPEDISAIVLEIGDSSIKIIKIMENDPRSVMTGGRFLNRYLPLIQQNLIRYRSIVEYAPEQGDGFHQSTFNSLMGMDQAFKQLTVELIQNDLQDLKVDLKVIDQLIQSDGFEIK